MPDTQLCQHAVLKSKLGWKIIVSFQTVLYNQIAACAGMLATKHASCSKTVLNCQIVAYVGMLVAMMQAAAEDARGYGCGYGSRQRAVAM